MRQSLVGRSLAHAEPTPFDETREHTENVRRMRRVLAMGLVLWNVVGIPNDVQVTALFELSYAEFTVARVLSTALLTIGFAGLFFSPSPRALLALELVAFVGASMGLAGLNHGLAGPTPVFLSCALLAQGVAIPRPWRQGLLAIGATFVAYPIGLAITEALTHRNAHEWADPGRVAALLHNLFLGACTLLFAVLGGDALHRVRRQSRAARRVGRYRLEERLGGGGMGEVWRARHPGLEQDVALKIAREREGASHLTREAELLSSLTHPGTVRVLDRGRSEEGQSYYAMELVRGETLGARIAARGPLSIEAARTLAIRLCRALAEAHASGIVHRDVKPENVMLYDAGSDRELVKLIDFGVATRVGEADDLAGRAVGSAGFVAPEQRRGAEATPRADVLSVGAVLSFALTGQRVLAEERSVSTTLREARERMRALPDPLGEVIARCLAEDPAQRFADASELLGALTE